MVPLTFLPLLFSMIDSVRAWKLYKETFFSPGCLWSWFYHSSRKQARTLGNFFFFLGEKVMEHLITPGIIGVKYIENSKENAKSSPKFLLKSFLYCPFCFPPARVIVTLASLGYQRALGQSYRVLSLSKSKSRIENYIVWLFSRKSQGELEEKNLGAFQTFLCWSSTGQDLTKWSFLSRSLAM